MRFGVKLFLLSMTTTLVSKALSQSYDDAYTLRQTLFANYSTEIRPLLDQSEKLNITVAFDLATLIEIDEIQQQIIINGFLVFFWKDEKLQWNPDNHNGVSSISPDARNIWRPRVVLLNTMGKRDLFDDDHAPIAVFNDGTIIWYPGGLFSANCALDLRRFPFDRHRCDLFLFPMHLSHSTVRFNVLSDKMYQSLFSENGGWNIVDTFVRIISPQAGKVPMIGIGIEVERRSTFFILNILLPVMALCILNVMVFTIPVDSGEKIGYSITVLLAFSVYMSIVNNFLPTNSENMPSVTIYIFFLFVLSVLCCVDTMFIVYLHHLEEEDEKKQKQKRKLTSAFSKLGALNFWKRISKNQAGSGNHHTADTTPIPTRTIKSPPSYIEDDVDDKEIEETITASLPNTLSSCRWHPYSIEGTGLSPSQFLTQIKRANPKVAVDSESMSVENTTVKTRAKRKMVYRNLAKKVNKISFYVFFLVSIAMTICFLLVIVA